MTLDIRTGSLLPGIAVAGFPAAAPPHRLLATGTLLLSGVTPGTRIDLGRHQQMWGLLPTPDLDRLVGAAEWAGVMGAGGAGFPTARKLASVAIEGRTWMEAYLDAQALSAQLVGGEDSAEGVRAFLEHRKPRVLDR